MTGAAPKRIKLPFPHPGQMAVRSESRRFNVLSAGRRWRKTTLAMAICVESAVTGGTYIWGAPTFDQVRISFKETQRAAAGVADFNQSRMTVTFPNGGEIVFRSLDNPDNARGYTADGVVIDESGVVKAEAWHEVLRPMLIDTDGWAWLIGTPKGRTWFYNEWAKVGDDPQYAGWQVPTLGVSVEDGQLVRKPHPLENPNVPFDEVVNLWRTMSERVFAQEILAQFVDMTGGVFRNVTNCVGATEQDSPIEGHEYVMGVDWAQSADFTVLTVIDVTDRSVAHIDRFNQIDYGTQVNRLQALYDRFRPHVIISEKNSMGAPLSESLQMRGLPVQMFTTTNATKAEIIQALALAFERNELRIPNDPVLIGELQAYEQTQLPSGMWRYSAPEGMHDDMAMSLAFAWYGAHYGINPVRMVDFVDF